MIKCVSKNSILLFVPFVLFLSTGDAKESTATKPEVTATAREIMRDFDSNPVAAKQKYMKRIVQVSGVISEINTKFFGGYKVKLSASDDLIGGNLICSFGRDKKDDIIALRRYQHVTLIGLFTGKIGNILIKDCSIVN